MWRDSGSARPTTREPRRPSKLRLIAPTRSAGERELGHERGQRLLGARYRDDVRAAVFEHSREELARIAVVLDEEHVHTLDPGSARRCHRLRWTGGRGLRYDGRPVRRQRDGKGRALASAVTVRVDDAALELDEVAHDREPEAEPAASPLLH